jgi:hypothetical protein
MRGQSQAVGARLRAAAPGRRWSTLLEETTQRRRLRRQERLEVIARLESEQRRGRRSGEPAPELRRLW